MELGLKDNLLPLKGHHVSWTHINNWLGSCRQWRTHVLLVALVGSCHLVGMSHPIHLYTPLATCVHWRIWPRTEPCSQALPSFWESLGMRLPPEFFLLHKARGSKPGDKATGWPVHKRANSDLLLQTNTRLETHTLQAVSCYCPCCNV